MGLKSKFMFLVGCILFIAFPTFAQTTETKSTETKPSKTIKACRIGLTGPMGRADFRFLFTYKVESDKDGAVKEVTKINPQKPFTHVVNEDQMPTCIKNWQLEPSTKYVVSFSIGTILGPDYISITDDKETLKIILD